MPALYLFDISAAVNQRAGIGRYAREILAELVPLMKGVQIQLWYAADPEKNVPDALQKQLRVGENLSHVRSKLSRRNVDRLHFRAGWPVGWLLGVGKPDVAYSPDFTVPRARNTASFVTIHDLAWMIAPDFAPSRLRKFLAHVVPKSIETATAVFTVSQTSKLDILERFRLSDCSVIVAPNAVATCFVDSTPLSQDARHRLRLPQDYLLMVGTIEPRKNHIGALAALELLKPELPLVIIGGRGWDWREAVQKIERLESRGRAIECGFLPDHVLAQVYAGAAAVIYPSWYEGFGLPVLEGLAAGTPVVASDLPVFHEIGGDLIDYVQPGDPASIASGIEQALSPARNTVEVRKQRKSRVTAYRWSESAHIVARRLQG